MALSRGTDATRLAHSLLPPRQGDVIVFRPARLVAQVMRESPAARAGLQAGDVIVEVNQKPVSTVEELRQALAAQKAGEPTLFQIHRKDASLFVAVTANG